MRDALLLQRQQCAQRPEHRISVVGPAAAVELVAFEARDPWTVSRRPPHHLRLLVEMAIEQHTVWPSPGTSMRMTGVRPGTLTTSRVAPGREDSFARAQRSNSATASSIYPWAAQSGSKAGDLFGILMYSTKVGTISSDQH